MLCDTRVVYLKKVVEKQKKNVYNGYRLVENEIKTKAIVDEAVSGTDTEE